MRLRDMETHLSLLPSEMKSLVAKRDAAQASTANAAGNIRKIDRAIQTDEAGMKEREDKINKLRQQSAMNHHLRNTELSLKAKGLLSLMLSLPENWDYTTKGLSCICKDGIDSINATVRELEEQG